MRKREEYEMNKFDSWMESYPKNWELTSVRGITENINQKNVDSKNTNYLSLMANVGVLLYADKGDIGNKLPDDLSKCKLVDIGDLVINSMNYGIGSYGISPYNGICSPVYLVLRSNKQVVLNEFAKRIFEIDKFQKHAQSFGTGILEHRRAINWDILKNIPVAIPDLATQQRIATFLDQETSKIDSLSDELTKFKVNLQLQKRSLVSECVTKGIPSEREGKAIFPMVNFGRMITSDNAGEVIPKEYWNEGSELLYTCQKNPMLSNYYSFEDRRRTKVGDLLLTRNGTPYIFIPEENSIYSNVVQRVKLDELKLQTRFAKYALENASIHMLGNGDIIASFNMGIWKRLQIPVPDLDEQQRIADYLDVECARIDALIGEIDNQVNLLKTYRKSLINEVVTGKVEV